VTVILAIDTSTTAVTVAVARSAQRAEPVAGLPDQPAEVVVRSVLDARAHTELLAPLVRDVLAEAHVAPTDLTGLAVGTGPGPFTGLRVGMVTALTMGHALAVPVFGVCSLDALGEEALASTGAAEVLVATDARRREVYWARYRRSAGGAVALDPPSVARPHEIPDDVRAVPVVGRGPLLYPELSPHPLGGPLDVDAGWLARVCLRRWAAGVAMPVEPLYLRRPDALTTAERSAR
jgi:tRNA threonylcarbamoyladenosine biosynthesis protein TsaB